ncbi:MAG TPA: sugar ABC transporter ATP-binding protein [Archaeoglobus sp.]|nr:sugar ABC transporter ATP-binding protein [Archaeoglobus sp.]
MEPILRVINLEKIYPGVVALKKVNIDFYPGEIHAIVGENGAGKSTLVEIISGSIKPTGGKIIIDGKEFHGGVREALQHGIAIVHQERALVPSFNPVQNIYLGYEKGCIFVDDNQALRELKKLMEDTGIHVNLRIPVKKMGEGEKQLVEILRLLRLRPKIMILDEPTASLSKDEIKVLFSILRKSKKQGVSVVIITHHLEEVFEIADRVTVLRNGKKVATKSINDLDEDTLINMMIEQDIEARYPKTNVPSSEEILKLEKFRTPDVYVEEFEVHKGEIVGLAGLVGSGRTEFLEALYGIRRKLDGKMYLFGKEISIRSPYDAIKKGIFLIPEDRNRKSLFLRFNVRYNITISFLHKFARFFGLLNFGSEKRGAINALKLVRFDINRLEDKVKNLSGGNKQKVSLGRWLLEKPVLYLMDEPTQGIDVGAKSEFFQVMCSIMNQFGVGVILVSSDLPELIAMSDKIYVFRNGMVVDKLNREEFSSKRILNSMLMGKNQVLNER